MGFLRDKKMLTSKDHRLEIFLLQKIKLQCNFLHPS